MKVENPTWVRHARQRRYAPWLFLELAVFIIGTPGKQPRDQSRKTVMIGLNAVQENRSSDRKSDDLFLGHDRETGHINSYSYQ